MTTISEGCFFFFTSFELIAEVWQQKALLSDMYIYWMLIPGYLAPKNKINNIHQKCSLNKLKQVSLSEI